jgi:hypothetical protein
MRIAATPEIIKPGTAYAINEENANTQAQRVRDMRQSEYVTAE